MPAEALAYFPPGTAFFSFGRYVYRMTTSADGKTVIVFVESDLVRDAVLE